MRKKLLSEAQVRRFQTLATIKPLNEMGHKAYKKDDYNEALYEEEEEQPLEAAADEPKMDEADVEMDEELVQKFMDAVETMQEVADVLGGDMGDMDDEGEDEGEDEPADDMGMDMGAAEEPAEEPEGDEEEMLQEALRGISYVPSQKEIVKTVAKRVAKRLQEAKRAEARLNRALGKRR